MITAAIDPGKKGAIALDTPHGYEVHRLPQNEMDLLAFMLKHNVGKVILENVGQARAGNGLVSAVNFGRHCQMVQSTLRARGFDLELVAPSKWIPAFLGADRPQFPCTPMEYQRLDTKGRKRVDAKYKTIRKKKIMQKVLDKVRGVEVSLDHADAMGLLLYHKGDY